MTHRPGLHEALQARMAEQTELAQAALERRNDAARTARNGRFRGLAERIASLPHGDRIRASLSPEHREMVDAHLEAMMEEE